MIGFVITVDTGSKPFNFPDDKDPELISGGREPKFTGSEGLNFTDRAAIPAELSGVWPGDMDVGRPVPPGTEPD